MGNFDHGTSYMREVGDDGELRPWHYIYVHSIESRLIRKVQPPQPETRNRFSARTPSKGRQAAFFRAPDFSGSIYAAVKSFPKPRQSICGPGRRSTLNPKPFTLNPNPPNPKPETRNLKPSTQNLNPKPETQNRNPKPETQVKNMRTKENMPPCAVRPVPLSSEFGRNKAVKSRPERTRQK